MKTQLVKALDLLKYPLPVVVKGIRGLYEVTKVVAEDGRVTCYRTSMQGSEIATLRKPYDGLFEVVISEQNTDHLLDTIGALHTRNKGLQKGHATLTRRVQELEQQLVQAQQDFLARAFGEAPLTVRGRVFSDEELLKSPRDMALATGTLSNRAVDAIIADVMKPEQEPTAADRRLADDIYSLRRRIACDLHDWSQQAEPVMARLAAAEHAIKLQNELRRSGK